MVNADFSRLGGNLSSGFHAETLVIIGFYDSVTISG
jgi:hypothetical protein